MSQVQKEAVLKAVSESMGDKCSLYTINQLGEMSGLLTSRLMGKPNKSQVTDCVSELYFALDLISTYLRLDKEEIKENIEVIYEELAESYKL